MLKGDTGKFLANLWEFIDEHIEPVLGMVEAVRSSGKLIPGAIAAVGKHGFAMSVEVRKANPPEIEATFISRKMAAPRAS